MTTLDQLKKLNNKSAIIARGIMDYFESEADDYSKLRSCQAAALEYARELGADISGTSLTSKVGKMMRDAGVFKQFGGKPKRGEGYTLVPGKNFDEFSNFLDENKDFGTSLSGQVTMSQIRARTEVMDHFDKHGAYRINGETHPVPSYTYNFLRSMLNEGKLDVVFVLPKTVVAIKHQQQTVKVGYWDD